MQAIDKVQQMCNSYRMQATQSHTDKAQENPPSTPKQERKPAWYTGKFGRIKVRVYERKTPSGNPAYMVANCSETDENGKTKRRFDCYADADQAKDAADKLAERISKRQGKAAALTESQAVEWVSSNERLKPFGVSIDRATSVVAECLGIVPDLTAILTAAKFFSMRHRKTTPLPVSEVVVKFLAQQKADNASERHLKDLKGRLERFAD